MKYSWLIRSRRHTKKCIKRFRVRVKEDGKRNISGTWLCI